MNFRWGVACLFVVCTFVLEVRAERAPLSLKRKQQESTHIVQGKVLGVYARDVDSQLYGPGTVVTQMVIEIEITQMEKGDGLEPQQIIYARCWSLKKRGAAGLTPGPSGHFHIPVENELIRAYLAQGQYGPTGQSDCGYSVVYPNGIESLVVPPKPGSEASSTDPPAQGK